MTIHELANLFAPSVLGYNKQQNSLAIKKDECLKALYTTPQLINFISTNSDKMFTKAEGTPYGEYKDLILILNSFEEAFLYEITDPVTGEKTIESVAKTPAKMRIRINESYNIEFIFESPYFLEVDKNIQVVQTEPGLYDNDFLYQTVIDFIGFVTNSDKSRINKKYKHEAVNP